MTFGDKFLVNNLPGDPFQPVPWWTDNPQGKLATLLQNPLLQSGLAQLLSAALGGKAQQGQAINQAVMQAHEMRQQQEIFKQRQEEARQLRTMEQERLRRQHADLQIERERNAVEDYVKNVLSDPANAPDYEQLPAEVKKYYKETEYKNRKLLAIRQYNKEVRKENMELYDFAAKQAKNVIDLLEKTRGEVGSIPQEIVDASGFTRDQLQALADSLKKDQKLAEEQAVATLAKTKISAQLEELQLKNYETPQQKAQRQMELLDKQLENQARFSQFKTEAQREQFKSRIKAAKPGLTDEQVEQLTKAVEGDVVMLRNILSEQPPDENQIVREFNTIVSRLSTTRGRKLNKDQVMKLYNEYAEIRRRGEQPMLQEVDGEFSFQSVGKVQSMVGDLLGLSQIEEDILNLPEF